MKLLGKIFTHPLLVTPSFLGLVSASIYYDAFGYSSGRWGTILAVWTVVSGIYALICLIKFLTEL